MSRFLIFLLVTAFCFSLIQGGGNVEERATSITNSIATLNEQIQAVEEQIPKAEQQSVSDFYRARNEFVTLHNIHGFLLNIVILLLVTHVCVLYVCL